jgi:hypothetical protein
MYYERVRTLRHVCTMNVDILSPVNTLMSHWLGSYRV